MEYKDLLRVIKEHTNCNTESCVLETLFNKNIIDRDSLREEVKKLKPPGPRNST